MNGAQAYMYRDMLLAEFRKGDEHRDCWVTAITELVNRGPRETLLLAAAFAAGSSRHMAKHEGEDFYRAEMFRIDPVDGVARAVAVDELDPVLRCAVRLTAAVLNHDRDQLLAVFNGFVGGDAGKGAGLIGALLALYSNSLVLPPNFPRTSEGAP